MLAWNLAPTLLFATAFLAGGETPAAPQAPEPRVPTFVSLNCGPEGYELTAADLDSLPSHFDREATLELVRRLCASPRDEAGSKNQGHALLCLGSWFPCQWINLREWEYRRAIRRRLDQLSPEPPLTPPAPPAPPPLPPPPPELQAGGL